MALTNEQRQALFNNLKNNPDHPVRVKVRREIEQERMAKQDCKQTGENQTAAEWILEQTKHLSPEDRKKVKVKVTLPPRVAADTMKSPKPQGKSNMALTPREQELAKRIAEGWRKTRKDSLPQQPPKKA